MGLECGRAKCRRPRRYGDRYCRSCAEFERDLIRRRQWELGWFSDQQAGPGRISDRTADGRLAKRLYIGLSLGEEER